MPKNSKKTTHVCRFTVVSKELKSTSINLSVYEKMISMNCTFSLGHRGFGQIFHLGIFLVIKYTYMGVTKTYF